MSNSPKSNGIVEWIVEWISYDHLDQVTYFIKEKV